MYNKRQFTKANDKKVMHKVKKQWVVLSLSLFMLVAGGAAAIHTSAYADPTTNAPTTTAVKDSLNKQLAQQAQKPTTPPNNQGKASTSTPNSPKTVTKQATQMFRGLLNSANQKVADQQMKKTIQNGQGQQSAKPTSNISSSKSNKGDLTQSQGNKTSSLQSNLGNTPKIPKYESVQVQTPIQFLDINNKPTYTVIPYGNSDEGTTLDSNGVWNKTTNISYDVSTGKLNVPFMAYDGADAQGNGTGDTSNNIYKGFHVIGIKDTPNGPMTPLSNLNENSGLHINVNNNNDYDYTNGKILVMKSDPSYMKIQFSVDESKDPNKTWTAGEIEGSVFQPVGDKVNGQNISDIFKNLRMDQVESPEAAKAYDTKYTIDNVNINKFFTLSSPEQDVFPYGYSNPNQPFNSDDSSIGSHAIFNLTPKKYDTKLPIYLEDMSDSSHTRKPAYIDTAKANNLAYSGINHQLYGDYADWNINKKDIYMKDNATNPLNGDVQLLSQGTLSEEVGADQSGIINDYYSQSDDYNWDKVDSQASHVDWTKSNSNIPIPIIEYSHYHPIKPGNIPGNVATRLWTYIRLWNPVYNNRYRPGDNISDYHKPYSSNPSDNDPTPYQSQGKSDIGNDGLVSTYTKNGKTYYANNVATYAVDLLPQSASQSGKVLPNSIINIYPITNVPGFNVGNIPLNYVVSSDGSNHMILKPLSVVNKDLVGIPVAYNESNESNNFHTKTFDEGPGHTLRLEYLGNADGSSSISSQSDANEYGYPIGTKGQFLVSNMQNNFYGGMVIDSDSFQSGLDGLLFNPGGLHKTLFLPQGAPKLFDPSDEAYLIYRNGKLYQYYDAGGPNPNGPGDLPDSDCMQINLKIDPNYSNISLGHMGPVSDNHGYSSNYFLNPINEYAQTHPETVQYVVPNHTSTSNGLTSVSSRKIPMYTLDKLMYDPAKGNVYLQSYNHIDDSLNSENAGNEYGISTKSDYNSDTFSNNINSNDYLDGHFNNPKSGPLLSVPDGYTYNNSDQANISHTGNWGQPGEAIRDEWRLGNYKGNSIGKFSDNDYSSDVANIDVGYPSDNANFNVAYMNIINGQEIGFEPNVPVYFERGHYNSNLNIYPYLPANKLSDGTWQVNNKLVDANNNISDATKQNLKTYQYFVTYDLPEQINNRNVQTAFIYLSNVDPNADLGKKSLNINYYSDDNGNISPLDYLGHNIKINGHRGETIDNAMQNRDPSDDNHTNLWNYNNDGYHEKGIMWDYVTHSFKDHNQHEVTQPNYYASQDNLNSDVNNPIFKRDNYNNGHQIFGLHQAVNIILFKPAYTNISYKYNGNVLSQYSLSNTSDGNSNYNLNSKTAVGLPSGYVLESNSTVPFDNKNHGVAIKPQQSEAKITFIVSDAPKGYNYKTSFSDNKTYTGNDSHAQSAPNTSFSTTASNVLSKIPNGYHVIAGQSNIPYDNQNHKVKIAPDIVPVSTPQQSGTQINNHSGFKWPSGLTENDFNKTITRTIKYVNIFGRPVTTIKQPVKYTRTATVDVPTGQVTYNNWSTNNSDWPKVSSSDPRLGNYNASTDVSDVHITPNSSDVSDTITCLQPEESTITRTIYYEDAKTGQFIAKPVTQKVIFKGNVSININPQTNWAASNDGKWDAQLSPDLSMQGYGKPNILKVPGQSLNLGSNDSVVIVKYPKVTKPASNSSHKNNTPVKPASGGTKPVIPSATPSASASAPANSSASAAPSSVAPSASASASKSAKPNHRASKPVIHKRKTRQRLQMNKAPKQQLHYLRVHNHAKYVKVLRAQNRLTQRLAAHKEQVRLARHTRKSAKVTPARHGKKLPQTGEAPQSTGLVAALMTLLSGILGVGALRKRHQK